MGNLDIIVTKLDTSGNTLWQYTYADDYNGDDIATAITVDDAGDVFVTGTIFNDSTNMNDIATFFLLGDGTLHWMLTYNGTASSMDAGGDVITDNSYVYVTGATLTDSNMANYITIKYNYSGSTIWTSTYDYNHLQDIATKIGYDNGKVYVSGISQSTTSDWAYAAIDLATADGSITGTRRSSGIGTGMDNLNNMTTDSSGNVYLTGAVLNGSSNYDVRTMKLNSTLDIVWQQDYNGSNNGNDAGNDVKVDNEGNVYVCGYTTTASNGKDYLTMKYDASGTLLWSKTENGAGNGNDVAHAMCLD